MKATLIAITMLVGCLASAAADARSQSAQPVTCKDGTAFAMTADPRACVGHGGKQRAAADETAAPAPAPAKP